MSDEHTIHPATAHAFGCVMNNGMPVVACVCGLPNKGLADEPEVLLTTDGVGIERKRRVLDALTREADETKRDWAFSVSLAEGGCK